jgi:hypothetical protein
LDPLLHDYFALKIYNKPFWLLAKKEKEEIDGLLAGGLQQGLFKPGASGGYEKRQS